MCLENVEQYHKDAELLIAIRSYGHALALVVLSEEEFAKAIMCHLWSEEILSQPSDFRKEEYAEFCQTQRAVGLALSHNLVNLAEEIRKCADEICGGRYVVVTHGGARGEVAEYIFPRVIKILAGKDATEVR